MWGILGDELAWEHSLPDHKQIAYMTSHAWPKREGEIGKSHHRSHAAPAESVSGVGSVGGALQSSEGSAMGPAARVSCCMHATTETSCRGPAAAGSRPHG